MSNQRTQLRREKAIDRRITGLKTVIVSLERREKYRKIEDAGQYECPTTEAEDELQYSVSYSGILIDPVHGYVLTIAQPMLNCIPVRPCSTQEYTQRHRGDSRKVQESKYTREKRAFEILQEHMSIKIIFKSDSAKNGFISCKGTIIELWQDIELFHILTNLIKEDVSNNDKAVSENNRGSISSQQRQQSVISDVCTFALISLCKEDKKHNICNMNKGTEKNYTKLSCNYYFHNHVRAGMPLALINTPFGSLNPNMFYHTVSSGIVSKVISQQLILTDANVTPGSEGGAVCIQDINGLYKLYGIVLSNVTSHDSQHGGLILVRGIQSMHKYMPQIFDSGSEHEQVKSFEHIGSKFAPMLQQNGISVIPWFHSKHSSHHRNISVLIETVALSIVCITMKTSWGSGILVEIEKGVILTCAHVVNYSPAGKTNDIEVYIPNSSVWVKAHVIFCAKENEYPDIAILQLTNCSSSQDKKTDACCINLAKHLPTIGENIVAVGYPMFHNSSPLSITSTYGCISNIMFRQTDGKAIAIQSSAKVYPGMSGGALISLMSGTVVGITVSNTMDHRTKIIYPYVNFSIPVSNVKDNLHSFIKTNDIIVLGKMCETSKELQDIWTLKNSGIQLSNDLELNIRSKL